ncbi:MAG: hypothetical protein SCH68_11295 [Brevefilum sp.]|jgi:hypothetical protein|nr:hypothetical protein [Brevefilum sp.]
MNTLFLVTMIIQAIFGLGFTLIPGFMLAPFGVTLDPIAEVFVNLFGAALLGYLVLLWYARKSNNLDFKKGTIYCHFVYSLIAMVVMIIANLSGLVNAMGWVIVAKYVVLLIWFGYFLTKK